MRIFGAFPEVAAPSARISRLVLLAATDAQTVLLMPPLMARLAREAPGLDLRVEVYGPDLTMRLESGALDFAFALSATPLPPGTGSEPVGRDRVALVMHHGLRPCLDQECGAGGGFILAGLDWA